MYGEINVNENTVKQYTTSLTKCAKMIGDAKQRYAEDNYTKCTSVVKQKNNYKDIFLFVIKKYVAKLDADVKNIEAACKAATDLDSDLSRKINSKSGLR